MTKFASFAQSMGVAIGGDTNRPSGAAGPVVSTFGSSYAQEKPEVKESEVIKEALQSKAPRCLRPWRRGNGQDFPDGHVLRRNCMF